jgi:UDP-2,3-diacylglucosamine hydrolase
LHPDIGEIGAIPVRKNKLISGDEDVTFLGEDNEWLILYSKRKLETKHYNYLIFWSPSL